MGSKTTEEIAAGMMEAVARDEGIPLRRRDDPDRALVATMAASIFSAHARETDTHRRRHAQREAIADARAILDEIDGPPPGVRRIPGTGIEFDVADEPATTSIQEPTT